MYVTLEPGWLNLATGVRFPAGAGIFFSLPLTGSRVHPDSYPMGTGGSVPQEKRSGCEASA